MSNKSIASYDMSELRRLESPERALKLPRQFCVNPYVALLVENGSFHHLKRFCCTVRTDEIVSPNHVVALMIAVRLFPTDWESVLATRLCTPRIKKTVQLYIAENKTVGFHELLEIGELCKEFVRPENTAAAQRIQDAFAAFFEARNNTALTDAFGLTSKNDVYRVAVFAVLLTKHFRTELGCERFIHYLQRLGLVTYKTLRRIAQLLSSNVTVIERHHVAELLSQLTNTKSRRI